MGKDKQARPLISVVVASYNYEDLIGEAFDSILAQTYDNYEIVVVDDGSTDDSLSVIKQYMAKTDKMRLYTHPGNANQGLPATVKLGVTVAQGEYVAFLECDDLWTPDHLEKKVAVINKYDGVNIVSNDVELFGDEQSVKERRSYLKEINKLIHEGKNQIDLQEIGRLNVIPTFSSVLVSKKLLSVLNYDTPIPAWIDFWLYRQIFNMGQSLYYIPGKLTKWRQHEDSYNGLNEGVQHQEEADIFFLQGNRMLGIVMDDREHYTLAKGVFHNRTSYKTARASLHFALQNIQDKALRRRLRAKFFWYRIVQFWKNGGLGGEIDYVSLASSEKAYKKILVVFHELSFTGAPLVCMTLCKVLRKQGADVTVLSPALPPKGGNIRGELESFGMKIIVDPMLVQNLYVRNGGLSRFLEGFDEIVFNTLDSVMFSKGMRGCDVKKVAWLHEGYFSYQCKHAQDVELCLGLMDEVYAVGQYAKAQAEKNMTSHKDIGTLLYGVEDATEHKAACKQGGILKFLFVGSLNKRKGIYTLINAMDSLSQEAKQKFKVSLVGVMHEKDVRIEGWDGMEWLGEKSHDEVLSCMAECDVLLCPSLDDPMPTVCTEAMMLGKPVVASTNTGTASLIDDGVNGFVVKAGDAEALADTIERVCAMRGQLEDMGRKARKVYEEHFSMPIFEKNVKRIFLDPLDEA